MNKRRAGFAMWMLLGVLIVVCGGVDFLLRSFGCALFGLLGYAACFWNAGKVGSDEDRQA